MCCQGCPSPRLLTSSLSHPMPACATLPAQALQRQQAAGGLTQVGSTSTRPAREGGGDGGGGAPPPGSCRSCCSAAARTSAPHLRLLGRQQAAARRTEQKLGAGAASWARRPACEATAMLGEWRKRRGKCAVAAAVHWRCGRRRGGTAGTLLRQQRPSGRKPQPPVCPCGPLGLLPCWSPLIDQSQLGCPVISPTRACRPHCHSLTVQEPSLVVLSHSRCPHIAVGRTGTRGKTSRIQNASNTTPVLWAGSPARSGAVQAVASGHTRGRVDAVCRRQAERWDQRGTGRSGRPGPQGSHAHALHRNRHALALTSAACPRTNPWPPPPRQNHPPPLRGREPPTRDLAEHLLHILADQGIGEVGALDALNLGHLGIGQLRRREGAGVASRAGREVAADCAMGPGGAATAHGRAPALRRRCGVGACPAAEPRHPIDCKAAGSASNSSGAPWPPPAPHP